MSKRQDKKKVSLKDAIEDDLISKLKENLQESFFSYQKQDQMFQCRDKDDDSGYSSDKSETELRNEIR